MIQYVLGPEGYGHHGEFEEPVDVTTMKKCEHGNCHDNAKSSYNEEGKLVHGGHDGDAKKSTEGMEKCQHGNFHDKDGTVYEKSGNKIHGPGGHQEENEEEWEGDCGDSIDYYEGMHNLLGVCSAQLMTAIDLSCHKSAVDLGGMLSTNIFINMFLSLNLFQLRMYLLCLLSLMFCRWIGRPLFRTKTSIPRYGRHLV